MAVQYGPDDGAASQRLVKETLLELIAAFLTRNHHHTVFDTCRTSVINVNVRLLSLIVKGLHSFFKDSEDGLFQLVLAFWIVDLYRLDFGACRVRVSGFLHLRESISLRNQAKLVESGLVVSIEHAILSDVNEYVDLALVRGHDVPVGNAIPLFVLYLDTLGYLNQCFSTILRGPLLNSSRHLELSSLWLCHTFKLLEVLVGDEGVGVDGAIWRASERQNEIPFSFSVWFFREPKAIVLRDPLLTTAVQH